jgi:hypothetical protein
MRYLATSLLIVAAFALALYQREAGHRAGDGGAGDGAVSKGEPVTVLSRAPDVETRPVADGTRLVVRYRFAGSCSRAKLIYRRPGDRQGEERVLAATTDCRRSLSESAAVTGDGYTSEVELAGTLPHDATDVRLVLESETGTRVARVEF